MKFLTFLRITNKPELRITNSTHIRNSFEFVIRRRRGGQAPLENRFLTGQAALTAVMFLLFISLAVSFGFIAVAIREAHNAAISLDAKRSFFLAEAGVEDVTFRIKTGKAVASSQSYSLNGGQATVITTDVAGAKEIAGAGNVHNAVRNIKTVLRQGLSSVGFPYGVQVDAGGLTMNESSKIDGLGGAVGNVYSDGPITGASGATITGSATVAGSGGSASQVVVQGDLRVHAITSASSICGDAYYTSIDAGSFSFLNSPQSNTCPLPLTPGTGHPGSADSPVLALPISSSQIQQWKDDAALGGTINDNCGDSGAAECTIADTKTLYLGPKKIIGNLVLTKKQTLIITGTLYVTGSIRIESSSGATITCDPSYGPRSCMMVTDSWVHVKNNAIFQGSGSAGSFLMVLSTLSGCNGGTQTPACTHHNGGMDFHNNATGAIFYSPYSMINLHNGVHMTELTAYKLQLDNNALVTYEQGLANLQFSSGPSGGWVIQSWQEVE